MPKRVMIAESKQGNKQLTNDIEMLKNIENDFKSEVRYLRLTNPQLRQLQESFSVKQTSWKSFAILLFSYICIAFTLFVLSLYGADRLSSSWVLYLCSILMFTTIIIGILAIIIAKSYEYSLENYNSLLINILTIAGCIQLSFSLFTRIYTENCTNRTTNTNNNSGVVDWWSCNPQASTHALPQDTLLMVIFYPILLSVVLRCIRWEVIITTWIITIISITLCIAYSNAYQSITTLLIYIPISYLIIYENQRQNLVNFFMMQRFYTTTSSERNGREAKFVNEYRCLMGMYTHQYVYTCTLYISCVYFVLYVHTLYICIYEYKVYKILFLLTLHIQVT